MSALAVMLAKFVVLEWHKVTVASSVVNKSASGLPTIFERPTIATFLPSKLTWVSLMSSRHPLAVHGINPPL